VKHWYALAGCPMDQVAPAACLAEELGFEGVTFPHMVVTPQTIRSPYPYTPDGSVAWDPAQDFADPWVTIGMLSALTTRLRFCTNVVVAPVQDPFTLAKSVSTAAALSGGRVVFGVGSGWMAEQFDLAGVDFASRQRRLDEMVEVMRALFTGEMVGHHGELFDFEAVQMRPVPARPGPICGGGHSDRALRRAAALDGWLGVVYSLGDLVPIVARLAELRAGLGRGDEPFEVLVTLAHDPSPGELDELEALGVTSLWKMAALPGSEPVLSWEARRADLERFAQRYLGDRPVPASPSPTSTRGAG
jgi:probable F420-dependent oxidoreductase